MKAFKVCIVTDCEEFDPNMRVEICAAESAQAAKSKYNSYGCSVVEVLDVTRSYTLDLASIRDVLTNNMQSNSYNKDLIALLLSILNENYDNAVSF